MAGRAFHSIKAHTTQLTARETSVIQQVAHGLSNEEVGKALGVQPGTVTRHLSSIGDKLLARSRPVKVHAAIVTGALQPPEPLVLPWEITEEERRAWQAVATRARPRQIARFLGLSELEASLRIQALMARAAARNTGHLVWLGHAYQVLDVTHTVMPPDE
ncbi:helix-turn-helix domain-containing protein [Streptomyces roseifaciens]|uniref:helix-turn-helix domain-containing protein n=1 Tax=Streptomyces roseifaciens TaxID=1488406 RepID=UPI000717DF77|nr:helix-turn-helix transcriptional regulator [Streptomyces roseifaciens]